jgi:hypothetical protein
MTYIDMASPHPLSFSFGAVTQEHSRLRVVNENNIRIRELVM